MEINVNSKILRINDKVYESSFDEAVECDVTLPDYCPDIKKILKCSVSPRLVSSRCTGDRVNVEANAAVRVIYCGDDNKVFCYEKTVPISKTVDLGEQLENPCVKVRLHAAYANVRALSARKLEVRGSIGFDVAVTAGREENFVCDAENGGIQLLKNCSVAQSFVGETVKNFNLTETVELGDDRAPVLQVLRASSEVFDTEIKAVNNKALLKGVLKINILYVPDDSERRPQIFVHSMPISQIVDLDGASDKTENYYTVSTNGVEVGVKTNALGERRLIDVDAGVIATFRSSQKIEQNLPTDCFSTKYEVDVVTKPVRFENLIERICDKIAVRSTEKINGIKIDEIYDVWCDRVKATASYSKEGILLKGEAIVPILGMDESGVPFYVERNLDFEKTLPAKSEDSGSYEIRCDVNAVEVGFVLGGEDTVELRLDATVCVDVFASDNLKLISSITLDSDSKKPSSSSFTVYFADAGETLWDIARSFNTTVDSIMQENDPSVVSFDGRRMLFVPIV
ncbi:MAG: DUF3794 domain-containing protein [Clostridia bacterium]|nr:DUF3794 domain-containing protein [Clostridia bacterium]